MDEVANAMLQVVVVGAGLGGLAAAISCAKSGLAVKVLEKAPEFLPLGAGIQIPPNGVRALRELGLDDDRLCSVGAVSLAALNLRRYKDGRDLLRRPGREAFTQAYGAPCVIHRADYHKLLLDEAVRSGVEIVLGAEVETIDFGAGQPILTLKSGQVFLADVVVGADGLWSRTRSLLLERETPPIPTGDMAYRATFSKEQLQGLGNQKLDALISKPEVNCWIGPNAHAVLYPVKDGALYNLVLLCPDTLPPGFNTIEGDVKEMRNAFAGWDPMLGDVLRLVNKVLKWKLCHQDELVRWTKGNVVIIGDASHPTLPYQAQGAAMAVEDGVILGRLLGRLASSVASSTSEMAKVSVSAILQLFEQLRKHRTTVNVIGAVNNRKLFHMEDGVEQEERDEMLRSTNWTTQTSIKFTWNDLRYQTDMLGFDFIADADTAFDELIRL